jgi:hypothetical protein
MLGISMKYVNLTFKVPTAGEIRLCLTNLHAAV